MHAQECFNGSGPDELYSGQSVQLLALRRKKIDEREGIELAVLLPRRPLACS